MAAIDRARTDRAEGRLWKARDRLNGVLSARSYDPECLNLLGEIYWEMGGSPAAGRAWYLTTRDDSFAESARRDFELVNGGRPEKILESLVIKVEVEQFPEPVQDRLNSLIGLAGANGYKWIQAENRLIDTTYASGGMKAWEWFAFAAGVLGFVAAFTLAVGSADALFHWIF